MISSEIKAQPFSVTNIGKYYNTNIAWVQLAHNTIVESAEPLIKFLHKCLMEYQIMKMCLSFMKE